MVPTRDMLREIWAAFPNPDDNFIQEFQAAHFDARICELCLFAVGHFGAHKVLRPHDRPDFLFQRDGFNVWIEATTANGRADPRILSEIGDPHERAFHQMNEAVPIRLGSALYSKLKKAYWTLPHVNGQPFVIAIEDFSDPEPLRMSDSPLIRYLYGIDHRVVSAPGDEVRIEQVEVDAHRDGDKVIPSGFFDLPGAENVSAVIFSNEGTVAKLKRMMFDPAKYPYLRMIRVGSCLDFDPAATAPNCFGYLVGDPDEEWGHGMYVYHNPGARRPIPISYFEGFSGRHWFEGGVYDNLFREFAPYNSITMTCMVPESHRGDLPQFEQYLRGIAQGMAAKWFAALHGDFDYQAWLRKRSQKTGR